MPQITSLAQAIINKAKEEKTTTLDLGFCGLNEIPDEVLEMYWLEELNLSNYFWDSTKNKYIGSKNSGPKNHLNTLPEKLAQLKNLKKLVIGGFDMEEDYKSIAHWNISTIENLPPNLNYLDISFNRISAVDKIDKLQNLETFILTGNYLTDIPLLKPLLKIKILRLNSNKIDQIKNLDSLITLEYLSLSDNPLSEIQGLHHLVNLTNLYINSVPVTEIKNLDTLIHLNSFELSGNKITEIKGLDKLTNLNSLDISSNKITEIKELDKLTNLNSLDISSNKITEIKGLDKLANLNSLYIRYNKIAEIKELDKLNNLNSLDISSNKITEIKGLDKLNNLNSLDISYNQITEIKGLDKLNNLNSLDISYNQITEIKGLDKLNNLNSLYISSNKITEIKGLDKLNNLNSLDIRNNKITDIKGLDKLNNLNSLNIRNNKITDIKGLDKLNNLNSLYISSNKITEIKGLDKLNNLNSLYISSNQITEIKGLDKLNNLNSLDISDNQITDIKGLDKLNNLNSLNISYNQIADIKGLDKMNNLNSLDFRNNKITDIKGLDKLNNLNSLDFRNNKITDIKGLDKLNNLNSLNIRNNKITDIKGLDKLNNLNSLNISSNQITDIKGLDKLNNLNSLDISDNQITDIKGLDKLNNLNSLDISDNKITEIKGLDKLANLNSLNISYNQIADIKGLDKMNNLNSLDISDNKITEIKGLDKLNNLNSLDISDNKITEIKGLDKLNNLNSLDISDNKITEIKGLDKLANLNSLDISYNQITEIKGLDKLRSLKKISLSYNAVNSTIGLKSLTADVIYLFKNPLKDVPQVFLGYEDEYNCLDDLQIWWDETKNTDETKENKLVKLQVTGNGNAGKSSLIEALNKGICKEDFESTHGIIIEPVKFEINGEESIFQAWDFGGQEIYHGTHRLFISSECLMLIVADYQSEQLAEKNETIPDRTTGEPVKNQPLEHYKELVERQSPSSIIVIVENKIDCKTAGNNHLYQKAAKNNLPYFCEVSAKYGTGIIMLRAMLSEKSKALLHYGMLMPKSWLDVQEYFLQNLELPKSDTKKTISIDGFKVICNRYKVIEKAQDSLLAFLHHTGIVYVNKNILKETIITDQRWALDAIYVMLDRGSNFYDEMRNDYRGRVRAKTIFKELGKNYSRDEKWLFIHFMQSCGLCFPLNNETEIKSEETYYVFPQFLPEEETNAAKDLWKKAVNVKEYRRRLSYFDYSRLQQFIVDIGKKTKHEFIWRYGIVVVTDKGLFRVEADKNNPAVQIQIEAAAEDDYLLSIINTFSFQEEKQNNLWFEKKERTDVLLDIEALKRKLEEKKHTAGISDKKILTEHLQTEKDTETKEQRLTVQLKDVVQLTPKRLVVSYASEDINALKDLKEAIMPLESNGQFQLLYDKKIMNGKQEFKYQLDDMFEDADGYIILVSRKYQNEEEKKYIWENEIPIILKRNKEEHIPIYCLPVAPVIYSPKIKPFAVFRPGTRPLPESGHQREAYLIEFINEEIENKFLSNE